MSMTKKDYKLIAGALSKMRPDPNKIILHQTKWYDIVGQLAEDLKKVNPKFDKMKFWQACGLAE